MRIRILILAAFVFVCLLRPSLAGAADVTLNLQGGINPGGTADMDLSPVYHGGVYVGMLNWTVNSYPAGSTIGTGSTTPGPYPNGQFGLAATSTSPGATVYTYCIDTASIIWPGGGSVNGAYAFNVESASSLATGGLTGGVTYSTSLVGDLEYLFAHGTVYTGTGAYVGTGNVNAGNTSNIAGISNDDAETFQMALWDLINGWNGSSPTLGDAAGDNPYDGGSATDIANAYLLATQAVNNGGLTYYNNNPGNFQALISDDGGQNQAIIFNELSPNFTPVPLPSVASTGLVLLTGVAGLALVRRRFTAVA